MGNLFRAVGDSEARAALAAAWDCGVRYFDTAPLYGFGLSERRIGGFLRERPRDAFVVSTKVGRVLHACAGFHEERRYYKRAGAFKPVFDYSHAGVMRSYEDSLQRLGLTRVDILLMHDIGALTHGSAAHRGLMPLAMDGGYKAMDELRRAGEVRALGLGVNEWQVCEEAMDCGDFDCFLLAGRYTLLEQEALCSFLPRCARAGVAVIAGGVFNSGILAAASAAGAHYNYEPAPPAIAARARRIAEICAAHQTPPAAAALQFPLAHPAVTAVIPGARSAGEVRQNAALMKTPIPPALWDDLRTAELLRPDAPTPR